METQISKLCVTATQRVLKNHPLGSWRLHNTSMGFRYFRVEISPLDGLAGKSLEKVIKLDEQMAMTAKSTGVRSYRNKGVVSIEYNLPETMWRNCTKKMLSKPLTIGAVTPNQLISFGDFTFPHTGIFGTSGSGKTTLIKTILWTLALKYNPRDLQLFICDPNSQLTDFDNLAHLKSPIARSDSDMAKAVGAVHATYLERKEAGTLHGTRVLLLIDEASQTLTKKDTQAIQQVIDLVSKGRTFNINVIFGNQDNGKNGVYSEILTNLANRFIGTVVNASESTTCSGKAGLECHKLQGSGDFVRVRSNGTAIRFQVANLTPDDFETLPRSEFVPPPEPATSANYSTEIPQPNVGGRPQSIITEERLAQVAWLHKEDLLTYSNGLKYFNLNKARFKQVRDYWLNFTIELKELNND